MNDGTHIPAFRQNVPQRMTAGLCAPAYYYVYSLARAGPE
jgi:hypothetical protein